MTDAYGRKIDYMRVSITDRCNLRCTYCMPEPVPSMSHDDILRFEEVLRLCRIMAKLGIKTMRITGGEPLVRKGWLGFTKSLLEVPGLNNVTLTTNAVLLGEYLEDLAALGISGINISLDSLCPDIYRQMTGFDMFAKVWESINRALALGVKLKINCVPIQGLNDCQILPLADLTQSMKLDVRFIELMPTGVSKGHIGIKTKELLKILVAKYPDLRPDGDSRGFGPAKYYRTPGGKGSVGFISARSEIFCAGCNRIRLSSSGFLTLCLHHSKGIDLRGPLRNGASDQEIEVAIKQSVNEKPEKHFFQSETELKHMSKIGG